MVADLTFVAWAAGLYDGEGSSSMYVPRKRFTARRQMQVSQSGALVRPPEVLLRFRSIVGEGSVTGPYRDDLFYWKTTRKDAIDRVATLLWPFPSVDKRAQFESMTRLAGRIAPPSPEQVRDPLTELAWAAGFYDGEGSAFVSGARSRPYVKLEVPQSSDGAIPETLVRFREAVGAGFIGGPYPPRSPWSRFPQYRWSLGSRDETRRVLDELWPWLSTARRDQAKRATQRVLSRDRAT